MSWAGAASVEHNGLLTTSLLHRNFKTKVNMNIQNPSLRAIPRALAVAALAAVFAPAAFAQPKPLETAAGWKAACETNPGNLVVLDQDITVSPLNGAQAASAQITTGCVIELRNDASLQLDRTTFTFGGPLIITGASKTELAMDRSEMTASAVNVSLSGDEGQLRMKESRVSARQGGNFNLTLGAIAKMEISGLRRNYEGNGTSTNAALFAEGDLSITVGNRFTGSVSEGILFSQRNLSFRALSGDVEVKMENTTTYAPNGAVAVSVAGGKAKLEYSNSPITGGTDVDVLIAGAEGSISFSNSNVTAGAAIELHADGEKSAVRISNGFFYAPGAFYASAGANGAFGELSVENAAVTGGTPVSFATGANGKTMLKSNSLKSTANVSASAGAGGVCEAIGNRVTSPAQSLCQ